MHVEVIVCNISVVFWDTVYVEQSQNEPSSCKFSDYFLEANLILDSISLRGDEKTVIVIFIWTFWHNYSVYLCIQKTPVPTKEFFPAVWLVVNRLRTSLFPAHVDMLVFKERVQCLWIVYGTIEWRFRIKIGC